MKNTAAVNYLEKEAERFTGLAKDISLNLLKNPAGPDVEEKKRKALEHLVRAETYKDAAHIVAGHSRRAS